MVEDTEVVWAWQPLLAPEQPAVPVEVRGAPLLNAGSALEAEELAVPEQVEPAAQSIEVFEVETADGPEGAGACPGRVISGPEEARELLVALQPPPETWQPPLPVEVFGAPLLNAVSAPVAAEVTVPEQDPVPEQPTVPDACDTVSNPPVAVVGAAVPGWPAAVSAALPLVGCVVGWVNVVCELERAWQSPPVAVQPPEPVEVLATAGGPAWAVLTPVVGSVVMVVAWSPAPVLLVLAVPLPVQPVTPAQFTVALAWLSPVGEPAPVLVLEPDWAVQPPVAVQVALPVVSRVTRVPVAIVPEATGTAAGVPVGEPADEMACAVVTLEEVSHAPPPVWQPERAEREPVWVLSAQLPEHWPLACDVAWEVDPDPPGGADVVVLELAWQPPAPWQEVDAPVVSAWAARLQSPDAHEVDAEWAPALVVTAQP